MKKHLNIWNLILVIGLAIVVYLLFDLYELQKFAERQDKLYNRIEYLINEGYSFESAKHMANVEFGIIPADAEYQALIED